MKVIKILLAVAFVAISLGCQDAGGKACTEDADCGADWRCEAEVCVSVDGGCGGCSTSFGCRDGECLPECSVDADCAEPTLCADGLCEERTDVECFDASRCDSPPTSFAECFEAGCDTGACTYTVVPSVVCQAGGCEDGSVYVERLCGSDGNCPDADTTQL